MIIPLWVVRPHPVYTQLWAHKYKEDADKLEQIQQRATEMVRGLKHRIYEDKLREGSLSTLYKF